MNQAAHDKLVEATRELAQFSGTEAMRSATRLLDALEATYLEDMRHIEPTNLVGRQTALKQLVALRQVFTGTATIPRV